MSKFEANIKPPQKPGLVSDLIRALPANRSVLISDDMAEPTSVRSIVTRIRGEFNGSRVYQTATESGGVRVWRTQ